jgi:hypothetical protein
MWHLPGHGGHKCFRLLCAEENINCPFLPVEMAGVWYAGSRLSLTCLTMKVWRKGSRPTWYTYISRCLEKTSRYCCTCLSDLLAREDLSSLKRVEIWSDPGPCYRSYMLLGTLLTEILPLYTLSIVVSFGCEMHMKSEVDSFFGRLAGKLRNHSLKHAIMDGEDCVKALEEAHWQDICTQTAGGNNEIDHEVYIHYNPPKKADCPLHRLYEKTCPAYITECYCWSFIINDQRRIKGGGSLFGVDHSTMTGVSARASLLSGFQAKAIRSWHPRTTVVPLGEVEVEVLEVEAITPATHNYQGWRYSFKTNFPEKEASIDITRRMGKKVLIMRELQSRLPVGKRHRAAGAQPSLEHKAVLAKARGKALALRRGG